jgi:hypothetical protein
MTSPEICTGGTVSLDGCAGPMSLCISAGFVWDGTVALRTKRGAPADWPDGTATRLRFTWGTGTELIVAGTVDGTYLRFHLTADETAQLPRGTIATIDLNWDGGDPDLWRPWRTGRIGC